MQAQPSLREMIHVLGLAPQTMPSQLWLSDQLAKGLPVAALEHIQATVAPSMRAFTRLVIPEATYKKQKSSVIGFMERFWILVFMHWRWQD